MQMSSPYRCGRWKSYANEDDGHALTAGRSPNEKKTKKRPKKTKQNKRRSLISSRLESFKTRDVFALETVRWVASGRFRRETKHERAPKPTSVPTHKNDSAHYFLLLFFIFYFFFHPSSTKRTTIQLDRFDGSIRRPKQKTIDTILFFFVWSNRNGDPDVFLYWFPTAPSSIDWSLAKTKSIDNFFFSITP